MHTYPHAHNLQIPHQHMNNILTTFLRIPCLDVAGVLLWTLASQMPHLPSGEAWASLSLYWMRTAFWLSVNQHTRMLRSLATIECRTLSTAFNSRHVELCLASVSDH